MTVAQIEIPEARIADLCRRSGIRRLALFGSVLTSRFSDSSDIDVLVEFHPEERVGFFRLADIEEELSRVLDGRKVDVRTPMELSRYFRDEVVRVRAGSLCRVLTPSGFVICGRPQPQPWKWLPGTNGRTFPRTQCWQWP